MNIDNLEKSIRQRIKKGENLFAILQSEKISEEDQKELIERIEHGKSDQIRTNKVLNFLEKNWLYILIGLVLFLVSVFAWIQISSSIHINQMKEEYSDFGRDIPSPIISPYDGNEVFVRNVGDYKFLIRPIRKYNATVLVGRKELYFTLNAKSVDGSLEILMPYDVLFLWDELAVPKYWSGYKYIVDKYGGTRGQGITYTPYFNSDYVYNHESNNHIIPANENITKALHDIKQYQIVSFEGYLTNIDIQKDGYFGGTIQSSVSLTDRNRAKTLSTDAKGACEVMYIEKIIIGDKVYS